MRSTASTARPSAGAATAASAGAALPSSSPSSPSSSASLTPSRTALRWRRWGWLLAAVWLVFLLNPLLPALRNPDRSSGAVSVVAILAFAVLYLWSLAFRHRSRDPYGWALEQEPQAAWTTFAALVVLSAISFVGAGIDGAATFVFLAVYALFALPRLAGVVITVGLVVGCLVAPFVDPRLGDLDGIALSTALAGTTIFGVTATARGGRALAMAQRDLARLAVVEERGRVARDLHDLLGHSLTVVTLKAQLAARLVEADPARAVAEMEEVERLSRDALADVRAALAGYREASLGTELAGARQALAAAGITAHLPASVDAELPAEVREVFAWAVREGITNVVRHSAAQHCWVELTPNELVISDDGRGPVAGSAGSGLTGLSERARLAGASVTTGRSSAGGFRLSVTVDDSTDGSVAPRDQDDDGGVRA
ncbi:sensor histidine kinase [Quadrisphaera granulorum]|uniref:sensor histidine kinase n=1 Tax=Quadrisphaera granulorum TaxID=317664 RepID=UPI0011B3BAB6|nr:sensor histidine kinase [Quadrisphaera granulorum]